MALVYLGLGSNLGDRKENIRSAIGFLWANNIIPVKISSIIETEPQGGPTQGRFLNAVIQCHSEYSAQELLDIIHIIEKAMGRVRSERNGPRTIDIDILFYDQLKMDTPELTIPHPRIMEREFVLTPLREIAPDLVKEF